MPIENGTTITGILKKVGKNFIQLEEDTVTHIIPLDKIKNVNIDCAAQLLGEEPAEPEEPVEEPGAADQKSIFDSAKPFRVKAAAEAAAAEEEEEEAAAVKKAMFVHTCKFCRKNHFHCDCESSSSSSFSSSCSSSFGPSSSFKHHSSSSSFKHHSSSSSFKHHSSSSSFKPSSSSSKHDSSSMIFDSSSMSSSSPKSSSSFKSSDFSSSSFGSSSCSSSSFGSSESSSSVFKKKKKGFNGAGYGFEKFSPLSRNKKDFRSFLKKLVGCVITVETLQ
ncbi:hypothetical protein JOC77_002463 [Peribacillus deserti]|uniref:DUF2642 domain-containing protein n=1 Tax=Peribacillus deserti TaxID=673318 RepID=A0ABS2QIS9_9BACI|nr:hypothetical protein [Peribacillus deserti]MBM7693024.1 hypothetical protein [Peribacillus deserti]